MRLRSGAGQGTVVNLCTQCEHKPRSIPSASHLLPYPISCTLAKGPSTSPSLSRSCEHEHGLPCSRCFLCTHTRHKAASMPSTLVPLINPRHTNALLLSSSPSCFPLPQQCPSPEESSILRPVYHAHSPTPTPATATAAAAAAQHLPLLLLNMMMLQKLHFDGWWQANSSIII